MSNVPLIGLRGDRAGFWRRSLSRMIDLIAVWLPFQILAAILFVPTSGWVHASGGLTFTRCAVSSQIPEALDPPPPLGSNFSRECHVYFFGMETARFVQVGRTTREGTATKSIWRSYTLDGEGHPINGVSLDWFAIVVFVVYVVAMETRTGATLGDRAMGIRVLDIATPDVSSVPLRKIIIRYLALFLGPAPMFAIFLFYLILYAQDLDAIFDNKTFIWTAVAGAVVAVGWTVVLLFQIVAKRDPLYDRMAQTAVVRTSSPRVE